MTVAFSGKELSRRPQVTCSVADSAAVVVGKTTVPSPLQSSGLVSQQQLSVAEQTVVNRAVSGDAARRVVGATRKNRR